ncbi:MAG: 50S ribosomal protein L29 [Deltaproteobacteria bacterium]|nr:50S ribosomal protein L29 [Deltaproteobacteria bacterium]
MKGSSIQDLRGNEVAELERTAIKLRQELFGHRMKSRTNQLENTMLIRSARREIARVMTVISEKRQASASSAEAKE